MTTSSPSPVRSDHRETIGVRIARLRAQQGWTQQSLANRLAISRVAISQIEMGMNLPSERTITLMAGLFKMTPYALVANTFYPLAKAERLPETTCCYTQVELEIALMENDLTWLEQLQGTAIWPARSMEVRQKWRQRLEFLGQENSDEHEQSLLAAARAKLT